MELVNNLKQKLLVHVPLWMCVFLAVLTQFLPGTLKFPVLIFLFFAYFLLRYLWRKYLKKQGKLVSSGGVLFTLVFWGGIITLLYMVTTTESPKLVLYETSEPAVLGSKDHFPAPENTAEVIKKSDKTPSTSELEEPEVKSEIQEALLIVLDILHNSSFACTFLQQQNLIAECSESMMETVSVQLDNNAVTLELLFAAKKPEECMEIACKVWLIQTTKETVTQFNDTRRENAKSDKAPPMAEATLIDQWENVLAPIVVSNTVTKGWRHLRFTHSSGGVTIWQKAD